jgi:DNA-binding GntR family transcriptional regulator
MTNTRSTFGRSRGGSVRDKAYRFIQQAIATGALPAGGGISELLLAKHLGSSRTPIREAMHQLAAEGMLRQNASGGMLVAQLQREDIVELYELREALELFAVGKIARLPMRPADQERLQQLIDEVASLRKELEKSRREALDARQMERFIACDLAFHELLVGMANNSRLQKVVADTRLLISIFAISRGGHDRAALKGIQEFHQEILDAVVARNVRAAVTAVASHIEASRRERLADYDRGKRSSMLRRE